MKYVGVVVVVAAMLAGSLAIAQDSESSTTTSADLLGKPKTVTVPEDSTIILGHGDTKRVYFKHRFKSITLSDETVVSAVPSSDHVIEFTGLAAGETSVTTEREDGQKDRVAVITTVGTPHLVKFYGRHGRARTDTGEATGDSSDLAGFRGIYCNEVGCGPRP